MRVFIYFYFEKQRLPTTTTTTMSDPLFVFLNNPPNLSSPNDNYPRFGLADEAAAQTLTSLQSIWERTGSDTATFYVNYFYNMLPSPSSFYSSSQATTPQGETVLSGLFEQMPGVETGSSQGLETVAMSGDGSSGWASESTTPLVIYNNAVEYEKQRLALVAEQFANPVVTTYKDYVRGTTRPEPPATPEQIVQRVISDALEEYDRDVASLTQVAARLQDPTDPLRDTAYQVQTALEVAGQLQGQKASFEETPLQVQKLVEESMSSEKLKTLGIPENMQTQLANNARDLSLQLLGHTVENTNFRPIRNFYRNMLFFIEEEKMKTTPIVQERRVADESQEVGELEEGALVPYRYQPTTTATPTPTPTSTFAQETGVMDQSRLFNVDDAQLDELRLRAGTQAVGLSELFQNVQGLPPQQTLVQETLEQLGSYAPENPRVYFERFEELVMVQMQEFLNTMLNGLVASAVAIVVVTYVAFYLGPRTVRNMPRLFVSLVMFFTRGTMKLMHTFTRRMITSATARRTTPQLMPTPPGDSQSHTPELIETYEETSHTPEEETPGYEPLDEEERKLKMEKHPYMVRFSTKQQRMELSRGIDNLTITVNTAMNGIQRMYNDGELTERNVARVSLELALVQIKAEAEMFRQASKGDESLYPFQTDTQLFRVLSKKLKTMTIRIVERRWGDQPRDKVDKIIQEIKKIDVKTVLL
jgi:hypothetical protein